MKASQPSIAPRSQNHFFPVPQSRIVPACIEPLESRIAPAIILTGTPIWLEEGPGRTTAGQVEGMGDNQVTGAIERVAPHPTDAAIIYVAAVHGGIWKTTNGTAANPTWTPLTDELPNTAFSEIIFDPTDASGNTLWAAYGGISSGGSNGPLFGIIKTTDGGDTWTDLGGAITDGQTFRGLYPTGVNDVGTGLQIILAGSTSAGLLRSVDNGVTFVDVSNGAPGNLPNAGLSHITNDPGNVNRYYASVPGQGVFISTDTGATWTQINTGLVGVGASTRIEVTVSAAAGNPAFVGIISGGVVTGLFRTPDQGANWTAMDTPQTLEGGTNVGLNPNPNKVTPGGQAGIHFAILADRTNGNVVFVGGDRQPLGAGGNGILGDNDDSFPNSIGANDFSGRLFRGDASLPLGTQFEAVTHNGVGGDPDDGANGTAPHADSRDLVFDANGNILHADDGGLYRLTNPNAGARVWSEVIGNLRVTEFYSIAYDSVNDLILGGSQDTGVHQQAPGGGFTWSQITRGDGNNVAVALDPTGAGTAFRYSASNNIGSFTLRVQPNGGAAVTTNPALNGRNMTDANPTGFQLFEIATNELDQAGTAGRLAIGRSGLYESTDFGANLTDISIPGHNFDYGAIAYGGASGGVDNPDVMYVAAGGDLFVRTTAGGAFTEIDPIALGTPTDVVMNPDDWNDAYVIDSDQVFFTTDAGVTWTEITGNLGSLASNLQQIEFYDGPGDDALLVGGFGGVFRLTLDGSPPEWSEFGLAMPNTLINGLEFDSGSDQLIAGTWGRGAWSLPSVSANINAPGILTINGDTLFAGQNDIIRLVRNQAAPDLLEVYLNNATTVPDQVVPLGALTQIIVNGLGGNDTLILDSSNGLIASASLDGIDYDGGTGRDELQLVQPTSTDQRLEDIYAIGPNNGDGASLISDVEGVVAVRQLVQFQNIEPVLDLVPAATLTVNASPASNAISYSGGSLLTTGLVAIDNFETIEFSNKVALTINALAGSDEISLNNANVPTGLTGITVDGGHPTGSDRLLLSGTGVADAFVFAPTSLSAGAVTGVVLPVTYLATEHVVLEGAAGDDVFNLDGSNGAVSLLGNAGADRVNFATAAEGVVFDLDAVGVAQRVTTTDALVTLLDRLENFTGTAFNDILFLDAATFARDINGGTEATLPPGDKFFFDARGSLAQIVLVDANTGTITTRGYADVTFDEFETSVVTGSPGGGGFGAPGASDAFSAGVIYNLTQTLPLPAKPLIGRGPTAVAVGDVNGDGFPDMVTANSKSKFLSVMLGLGDGTFGQPTNLLSGGTRPTDLALADLDGDADLDIVVTNAGTKTVAVLLNAAGVFGAPQLTPKLKQTPAALAVGDVNADGLADVVVTHASPGAVSVFLAGAGGVLGAQALVSTGGKGTTDVVLGDFSGDGLLDIATANLSSGNVSFLLNAGAGVFNVAPQLFRTGTRPSALAVADFNNDGNLDLAVSHLVSRFAGILIGNGAPVATFKPVLQVNTSKEHLPRSIAAGDFNGDGKIDLAMGPTVGGELRVILGVGNGDFSLPYVFDLGNKAVRQVSALALADVNLDGQLDILTANTSSHDISVLLRKA